MKITLCGSTQFIASFNFWNQVLTYHGDVVYSVCAVTSQSAEPVHPEIKLALDAVHIAKIEESDAIFVITGRHELLKNQDYEPYIGESTAREMYYADLRDKAIRLDYKVYPSYLGDQNCQDLPTVMAFRGLMRGRNFNR